MTSNSVIAYFITPHGYGHAARAAAVMLALQHAIPGVQFEIYTKVPHWFFEASTGVDFHYHELVTDIGLAQDSVMDENLPETVRRLSEMIPFNTLWVNGLADEMKSAGCQIVLCDIAPLGIAVARAAGLPSVLTENFTWDWIYEGYLEREPRLQPYIKALRQEFASATCHIRTTPVCSDELPADLTSGVVGRAARTPAAQTRAALDVPANIPLVLLTMGGIGSQYPFLDQLRKRTNICFLIPGGSHQIEKRGNLILLPHHSAFYHPDLVEAADAVVGKLGYSTLAETYLAGVPFAFIPRPRFRESDVMRHFVLDKMKGIEISQEDFFLAGWLDTLPQLLSIPRRRPTGPNGADEIAGFIREKLLL